MPCGVRDCGEWVLLVKEVECMGESVMVCMVLVLQRFADALAVYSFEGMRIWWLEAVN